MARLKKSIPAAKPITFIAFGFLLAIAVLFLFGLVEFAPITKFEKVDISYVIDAVEMMTEDKYFEVLFDRIEMIFKQVKHTEMIGDAIYTTLMLLCDIFYVLFFLVVVWNLLFCWTPLAKVGSIGWSRASVRMSKKLRKVIVAALGYVVFQFAMFGSRAVKFTALGQIVIYAVLAFVGIRVLLKHLAKKDTIIHMILSTVASVGTAVFLMLFFVNALDFPKNAGSMVQYMTRQLDALMHVDGDEAAKIVTTTVMVVISILFVLSTIGTVKKAYATRVEDKGGICGAMIGALIWAGIAVVVNYIGWKMSIDELSFGDWKKWVQTKEIAEYMIRSVIYAAIGIGVHIVASILNKIGTDKDDEYSDDAEATEK